MFSRKKQPPIKSLIAHGTRIEGNVLFEEGMRIDGDVAGDIRASTEQPSILVISETARVEGAMHADHVIVNGRWWGQACRGAAGTAAQGAHHRQCELQGAGDAPRGDDCGSVATYSRVD